MKVISDLVKSTKYVSIVLCLIFALSCKKETEIKGDIFIVDSKAEIIKLKGVQITVIAEESVRIHLNNLKSDDEQTAAKEYQLAKEQAAKAIEEAGKLKNEYNAEMAALQNNLSNRGKLSTEEFQNTQTKLKSSKWRKTQVENAVTNAGFLLDKAKSVKERLDKIASPARYFDNLPSEMIAASNDEGRFTLKIPKNGKYALAASSEKTTSGKTEKYYWLIWIYADGKPQNIILSNNNTTDSESTDSLIKTTKYE